MNKPTSQQVPRVEPLSEAQARNICHDLLDHGIGCPNTNFAMGAIASGHHVVISATELSALRAREERLAVAQVRVISTCDSFCPGCGHNRDASSVSSISNDDGTTECQICGTTWREAILPARTQLCREQPMEENNQGVILRFGCGSWNIRRENGNRC